MHARMAVVVRTAGGREGAPVGARSSPAAMLVRPKGRSPGSRVNLRRFIRITFPRLPTQWFEMESRDTNLTRIPLRGQRRNSRVRRTGFPFIASMKMRSPCGGGNVGKGRGGVKQGRSPPARRPNGKKAFRAADRHAKRARRRLAADSPACRRPSSRLQCLFPADKVPPSNRQSVRKMSHSPFLSTALEAARAAAEVIRRYYRQNAAVTIKADKSPVTEADVESERVIRSTISQLFPAHGFYGEETGQSAIDAEYLWLVDPIDGTKAFVREYPFFSTQIALMHRGRLIVGVSSAPVYGELAYAEAGAGAWLGERRIKVSDIATIEGCAISTGNLKTLASGARWTAFGKLVTRA